VESFVYSIRKIISTVFELCASFASLVASVTLILPPSAIKAATDAATGSDVVKILTSLILLSLAVVQIISWYTDNLVSRINVAFMSALSWIFLLVMLVLCQSQSVFAYSLFGLLSLINIIIYVILVIEKGHQ
jgi:hypothetical protein